MMYMNRILVVDPKKDFTIIFSALLAEHGLEALMAQTAEDALKILSRGEAITAIAVASKLPDSSYGELIETIQSMIQYKNTPVYLLTESTTREALRHAFSRNVTEVYSKEHISELVSVIKANNTPKKIQGTVLYLDDSVSEALEVCMTLQKTDLNVIMHDNCDSGLKELLKSPVDIALTGLLLNGEETGIDFIRKVRGMKDNNLNTLPIMVLTSFENTSAKIESYHAGTDDFLIKPLSPTELIAKIARQIQKRRSRQTMEYRQNLYEKMAIYDALSGLYNRHGTQELAKRLIFNAKRNKRRLSMLVLDLDNFKMLNDSYGHSYGDKIIKIFSEILQQHVRANDIAGRWGGDEFILLLEDCNTDLAERIAERIIDQVSKVSIDQKLSVSIGICEYAPYLHKEFEDLFNMADSGMYEAKKAGKNCYHTLMPSENLSGKDKDKDKKKVTPISKKRKSI